MGLDKEEPATTKQKGTKGRGHDCFKTKTPENGCPYLGVCRQVKPSSVEPDAYHPGTSSPEQHIGREKKNLGQQLL